MKKAIILASLTVFLVACNQTPSTPTEENNTPEQNQTSTNSEVLNQAIAETYIRENISTLSPNQPLVGGTWYVTEINFDQENIVVNYEDGHVMSAFSAQYQITPSGEVTISNIQEITL